MLTTNRCDAMAEVKRLTLHRPVDKMINATLCQMYEAEEKHTVMMLPPPKDVAKVKKQTPAELSMEGTRLFNDRQQLIIELNEINVKFTWNHELILYKYFERWKRYARNKKDKPKPIKNFDEKLDKFIESLKSNKTKTSKHSENKRDEKGKESGGARFENRYVAQKHVIMEQKAKLLEQEKVIEELKYGKICENLEKSIRESKCELKEFYANMKKTTKTKLGTICKTVEEVIEIQANLAPKLVREMERRAQERALRRKVILEKKRIMDEQKRRQAQEAVEKKRVQDEEEKKAALDAIKLKRLKEVEMTKLRAINKQRYLEGCAKADNFYRKKLIKLGMKAFKITIILKRGAEINAEQFYLERTARNVLLAWHGNVRMIEDVNNFKADAFYTRQLLRKGFSLLINNCHLSKLNRQVAEDYCDFNLTLRVFKAFRVATMNESYHQYRLSLKAMNHYENRILVQYFYQWKSLKAVLQLERAKEEKKKKWRQRVLEILPDYKPQLNEF